MKHLIALFIFATLLLIAHYSKATVVVQRTANSSLNEYQKYVANINGQEFADGYLDLNSKLEGSFEGIESCLRTAQMGQDNSTECREAINSISSRPLNRNSREVLYSLLRKISNSKKPDTYFYKLKHGLVFSDKSLSKTFHETNPQPSLSPIKSNALIKKAWLEQLDKMSISKEARFLINGIEVSNFKNWIPSEGIFQFSLITNTHKPFIRIGTFQQFASSIKNEMVPFADNCKHLLDFEIEKFSLLEVQVFASNRCIAKESFTPKVSEPHLANLSSSNLPQSQIQKKQSWLFMTMIAVGAGLAYGLKDKTVEVTMPSFH